MKKKEIVMNMNRVPHIRLVMVLAVGLWGNGIDTSLAQTFSSGSTGALGALAPTANVAITLPSDGVLHYTTVSIPSGVTVTFVKNAANTPVTILATGDVTISGNLNVNGVNGQPGQDFRVAGAFLATGGVGGPGGFRGGNGSSFRFEIPAGAGQGPGGGAGAPSTVDAAGTPGTYGAVAGFVSLVPLMGGSGGGGGATTTTSGSPIVSGGGGGGGGGAVVIASSTKILVSGTVTANGGLGATGVGGRCSGASGSGGAIRLVAPVVTGTGALSAVKLADSCSAQQASGRVRIEAVTNTLTGSSSPVASVVTVLGPVAATSTPALTNLPILRITSVGGLAVPTVPTGSYATADISLPVQTTSAVPVVLTAVNTPLNTSYVVRLVPSTGPAQVLNATPPIGTPALSISSVNVTFPTGLVTVLSASAAITITTAGLFPRLDGEDIDWVVMAAAMGSPSTLTLITTSGREYPLSELSSEDQLQVAMAFEAMRTAETETR